MNKVIIAYVPVIHKGYLAFFQKHRDAESIYLLGEDVVEKFSRREIRALSPDEARVQLATLFPNADIRVLTLQSLEEDAFSEFITVVMPRDRITEAVFREYAFDGCFENTVFEDVFLKWDEDSVMQTIPENFDRISEDEADREFMRIADKESAHSSDWWRRVGAALVKDGKIIFTGYNHHFPTEYAPYINGDPRDFIKAGTMSHLCSAVHSEQSVIAEAAKNGVKIEGADIYVSVFPCPMCARLIALSGIERCFFGKGHASLDGAGVLKQFGVELIWVR